MPKYDVFFTPSADEEVLKSYEWGIRAWGQPAANVWLMDLYESVIRRLRQFPLSCPISPESRKVEKEIRNMVLGRYRVLFQVKEKKVIVFRVKGPFHEDTHFVEVTSD